MCLTYAPMDGITNANREGPCAALLQRLHSLNTRTGVFILLAEFLTNQTGLLVIDTKIQLKDVCMRL